MSHKNNAPAPAGDPLANPAFRAPGLLEKLREAFIGASRPLECVQIEVTSICSAACIYCPHTTQKSSWRSRNMQDSVFAALWPLLRQSQRAHLQGWGEPLLHPRFFDFANLARKAGCQVSSTSCGMRIDEKTAEKLVGTGLDMIAISLAGTDAASNDARRGTDFHKVCSGVKNLRRAIRNAAQNEQMQIHLAYLLLADRMDAACKLPGLMRELDVDAAIVSTLDYLALPEQAELAIAPHETEKIEKARDILRRAAAEAESDGRMLHYELPEARAPEKGISCRENVGKSLYIDADGKVSPCVYLNVPGNDPPEKRRVFGDITACRPGEIWQQADYAAFRQDLARGMPDGICKNCPKRFEQFS